MSSVLPSHAGRAAESDAGLLLRVRAGDEAAIRTLVSTYHALMTRFARSLVGEAGAEEIAQEA